MAEKSSAKSLDEYPSIVSGFPLLPWPLISYLIYISVSYTKTKASDQNLLSKTQSDNEDLEICYPKRHHIE